METYKNVEKVRFDESLEYSIEIDEKLREIKIPKFLIQPMVENAIKHGVSNIIEKGIIQVLVKQVEQDLQISIYDNGPDFPEDLVSGYGLQNLYDKLEIIYKEDASITWKNGDNKYIQITLKNQI